MYADVLDVLMPMGNPALESRDTEWVLQIRVRERDEPEFWSRIIKRYRENGSSYAVEVRRVWPEPLDRQLAQLLKASPAGRAGDLATKVRLRKQRLDKCPAAERQFKHLEQLSMPVLLDDTIALDAPSYEFTGMFRGGSVSFHLRGAENGDHVKEIISQIAKSLIQCS